jgi:hypothetical protein
MFRVSLVALFALVVAQAAALQALASPRERAQPLQADADSSAARAARKFSAGRFVYCFGGPRWLYGGQNSTTPGWWFGGTSTGWGRYAADGNPSLVSTDVEFVDSVSVMGSVHGTYGKPGTSGPCRTVAVAIQPGDPPTPGVVAGAQASGIGLGSNATNAFYGQRPSIIPQQGETWFYGFAAATNGGYVPYGARRTDLTFGNWNSFGLEFHSTIGSLGPLMQQIATIGPGGKGARGRNSSASYPCNSRMVKLARPRLEVALTGGQNDAVGSDGAHTCLRFQGPEFHAGRLYRVIYQVKWDAFGHGMFRWWVDSGDGRGYRAYADVSGVSTLWRDASGNADAGTYPQLLNYRKTDTSLPTAVMYYGGIIRGATMRDVMIPGRSRGRALSRQGAKGR